MEGFHFTTAEMEWLDGTGRFRRDFVEYLRDLRFTGDVHAMAEGTVFFADEPILRVTAPLPQAQIIETRIINLLHFQTVIASKAVRSVLAAPDNGNIDEFELQKFFRAGVPIDGFGIGSRLDTSADAPYLDCAYKIQEYAGRPRRKRSEGKATWPGRKQVFRVCGDDGRLAFDQVALEDERTAGTPLIVPVMRSGKRLARPTPLVELRRQAAAEVARLPAELRALEPAKAYPAHVSAAVRELAKKLDRAHS